MCYLSNLIGSVEEHFFEAKSRRGGPKLIPHRETSIQATTCAGQLAYNMDTAKTAKALQMDRHVVFGTNSGAI